MHAHTHLDVPVGEQQVDDDVGAQELHGVQPLLDAAQLLTQGLASEALSGQTDLPLDRLPEVLTVRQKTSKSAGHHTTYTACYGTTISINLN